MALSFGAILFGCNSGNGNQQECFYETYDVLVTIKDMKPHKDGDGKINVVLDFDGSSLALKDQDLSEFKKDVKIDHDFLVRNNIELGNKYEASVSEISTGDCIPLFVSFHHDLN